MKWNDPSLDVGSDSAWRRKYRRLQSWYRESELAVPCGIGVNGVPVGSMLAAEAIAANPGLNFLDADIAAYVDMRLPQIAAQHGVAEEGRLRRNLLSSQPLCFNLVGGLRKDFDAAGRVLSEVFDLDIAEVMQLHAEVAPQPPSAHLDDRTAFDAFVEYGTRRGLRGFLGIETKYTEPFSPMKHERERYRRLTIPANGFKPGADARLVHPKTNQLWRNALLAVSLRNVEHYDVGHVAVLACDRDQAVHRAVAGLADELTDPPALLRVATFEAVVAVAADETALAAWATAFNRRYLDLSPLATG